MQTVAEKIKQRRSQMLVHSHLYYVLDTSIVSDDTWQKWANELAQLQKDHPECCQIGFYDKEFEGWDGDTGCHLPLRDPWVIDKARSLLRFHDVRHSGSS